MGESLQQERESPWALTLTERVPEAFEIPPSDWPEKNQRRGNSRATLVSSYTRLFSSSIAVVASPVQREHFWGEPQKKKINEVEEIANYNVAARKQTLTGNFSRRTYRRYRKFLELVTSPFSNVTNYFSFFVDLRLKLSISDARVTQLCWSSVSCHLLERTSSL